MRVMCGVLLKDRKRSLDLMFMLGLNMCTLNINQSNVSTKLKKHDFVIPEIEVTSQLIDLRSSATLCLSVEVRP